MPNLVFWNELVVYSTKFGAVNYFGALLFFCNILSSNMDHFLFIGGALQKIQEHVSCGEVVT